MGFVKCSLVGCHILLHNVGELSLCKGLMGRKFLYLPYSKSYSSQRKHDLSAKGPEQSGRAVSESDCCQKDHLTSDMKTV